MGVLVKIAERFEKLFERSSSKQDSKQIDQDAQKTAAEESKRAGDAAVDDAKDHVIHDVRDKFVKAAPTKLGWLKFTFAVGAMFTSVLTYISFHPPEKTPEEKNAEIVLRHSAEMQSQIEYLDKIVVSQEDFNVMIGGLEVPSAPTPTPDAPVPAAAAALPPPIAAIAAEPVTVDVTTNGQTREFTSTVGQVYVQAPPPVRRAMERPDPPPFHIDHGYDHPDPNDCSVRHCLGGDINKAGGFHKDIRIDAVDGNGVKFGSARFH